MKHTKLILAATALLFAVTIPSQGFAASKFQKMDANKDKKVSKEEFLAFHGNNFSIVDSGKDGFIEPTEFNTFLQNNPDGKFIAAFITLDTNKDNKVSRDEFIKSFEATFTKKDRNKDGFLGPFEV